MQHRVFIIILAIYGISICQLSGQLPKVFSGKFSSEGDITAKGIITMELTQSGNKIEGVSVYQTNDGQLNTGLLSVNGYTKDNLGYIRFRDQKGNVVADGSINFKETGTLHFKQTTKSSFFLLMLSCIARILLPWKYQVLRLEIIRENIQIYNSKELFLLRFHKQEAR